MPVRIKFQGTTFLISVFLISLYAIGFAQSEDSSTDIDQQKCMKIQDKNQDQWLSIEGVNSVGIGACEGKPCILIGVLKENYPEAIKKIPKSIEGCQIKIKKSSPIIPF